MITGTGLSFRSVGVYSHALTAVERSFIEERFRAKHARLLDLAVGPDDRFNDDDPFNPRGPRDVGILRRHVSRPCRRLDVATDDDGSGSTQPRREEARRPLSAPRRWCPRCFRCRRWRRRPLREITPDSTPTTWGAPRRAPLPCSARPMTAQHGESAAVQVQQEQTASRTAASRAGLGSKSVGDQWNDDEHCETDGVDDKREWQRVPLAVGT